MCLYTSMTPSALHMLNNDYEQSKGTYWLSSLKSQNVRCMLSACIRMVARQVTTAICPQVNVVLLQEPNLRYDTFLN